FSNIIFTCVFFLLHICMHTNAVFAQQVDTVSLKSGSTIIGIDSLKTDSASKNSNANGINDKIVATAEDSTLYDAKNNIIYLYGKAKVVYGDKEVDAGFIRLDQKNNTIFARGTVDSLGRFSGLPIFKDPSQGTLTADSVFYNFKTSKGNIYQVHTEQEGGFISGGKIKKQANEEIHMRGVVYSTCDLPHPHQHFGI